MRCIDFRSETCLFQSTQKDKQSDRNEINCLIRGYRIDDRRDQEYVKISNPLDGSGQNAFPKYFWELVKIINPLEDF